LSAASFADHAGVVFLGLAVCGAIYSGAATWVTWRFLGRGAPGPCGARVSVTVLKPLHGVEPELYENLASFCAQDYPGAVRIVLAAQDPDDPALAIARRLKADHPDHDIVVISDPTRHGSNRKIGNLINMAAHSQGEVVVISDSDVRMPPGGLGQIVAALDAPRVGLIHALYRGRPAAGLWSRLAALDVNTRFVPGVVVGQALGAHPCLGPTMALRASLLQTIGGFERLVDFLADDFELGRAVRDAGYEVVCPPMLIDHLFCERSAGEMLAHELRWARTIRLVKPVSYLGSVIIHFLALGMIGAVLTGFSGWGLATLAALAVFRWAQARILSALLSSDLGGLWLIPLRDLLSFGVFMVAIFGDRVRWRGNNFRVRPDGVMDVA
jgi:ceramide glucosyltransferase